MTEPMKPCPFCESKDVHVLEDSMSEAWRYMGSCRNCGCRTVKFSERASAIKRWNMRGDDWKKPDRKEVCAEQAGYEITQKIRSMQHGGPFTSKDVAIRAIELYLEGFGK
jgi:Lar family restriction alleviation protein